MCWSATEEDQERRQWRVSPTKADHCPLYRQAQIYRRAGIDLHRSTLAGWVGKAAYHLAPVVDHLAKCLKSSSKLFMEFEGTVAADAAA